MPGCVLSIPVSAMLIVTPVPSSPSNPAATGSYDQTALPVSAWKAPSCACLAAIVRVAMSSRGAGAS
jgi:hypothetical protein